MTGRTAPRGFDPHYWDSFMLELDAIVEDVRLSDPEVLRKEARAIAVAALGADFDVEPEPVVVERRRTYYDEAHEERLYALAEDNARFHRLRRLLGDEGAVKAYVNPNRRGFLVDADRKRVLTASGAVQADGWRLLAGKRRR